MLHERARIEGNHIVLPDGMRYRLLVMPDDPRITRETLAKIDELVRAGMWLVGARVERSHGLRDYPNSDAEVRRLANGLWGDLDGKTRTSRACGKGRVFWGMPLERVLAEAGLAADVAISTRANDARIHWIHRRTADAEVYFVSNARRRPEDILNAVFVGNPIMHHLFLGIDPTELGGRSEERRVGKECRSRWSPYH